MIDPQELIATCYKLVSQAETSPPSEADLRRAVVVRQAVTRAHGAGSAYETGAGMFPPLRLVRSGEPTGLDGYIA